MYTPAIVTIVSNNYLHFARTLMQSVAKQHPDAHRYCVIVDIDPTPSGELAEEFEAISLSQIKLPFGDDFMFQYTILELNTAVKPWAMQYLLERGHEQVIYIDPDVYLFQPLKEVLELLHHGASVVLTPHLLAPITDDRNPNELSIRIAGTYNLGFCAVSNQETTRKFLNWWQGKLERDCVVDFYNGIFVDQSWIDLVPALFDNVEILRHQGYNVAYWNLAQRHISLAEEQWDVNGDRLVFFHFSGINPQNPYKLSKYQDRYTLNTVEPAVKNLIMQYCTDLVKNGLEKYSSLPYGYAKFNDGVQITPDMRTDYRLSAELRRTLGSQPFHHSKHFENTSSDVGTSRLDGLFLFFLGRNAGTVTLNKYREKARSFPFYLLIAFGVGRSAEARQHPGWILRLILWPIWQMLDAAIPRVAPSRIHESFKRSQNPPATTINEFHFPSPSSSGMKTTVGINLVGYIAAELGIGEAVRALARACSAIGIPYSVVDVGFQSSNLQRDMQAYTNASNHRFAIDLLYVNADQTQSTIDYLKQKGLESSYKIGFWHWEQPKLPPSHLPAFRHLNEIWVPSSFVRNAVATMSPVPVVIIPHALSITPTPSVQRSQFGLPPDKLLVLMMYDFHSYQYRKNPQAAIAAFCKATQGRDDTVLVVKTINAHYHTDESLELRTHLAGLPSVIIIDQFLTRQQTWDLQSCCDILVSLHRAEGFGLVIAEMMFLGKPVVATGWSANMDFMTPENSMPVKYTLKPLAESIGAYPAGPVWAEADIDHAASSISQLLDQPELRIRLGLQAARDIRRQLDPEVVGELVNERMQAIANWHPNLRTSQ
jgi:glycosyltransferase involved in cell wall biosynthesis